MPEHFFATQPETAAHDLAQGGDISQDRSAPPREAADDCECDDCDCPICYPRLLLRRPTRRRRFRRRCSRCWSTIAPVSSRSWKGAWAGATRPRRSCSRRTSAGWTAAAACARANRRSPGSIGCCATCWPTTGATATRNGARSRPTQARRRCGGRRRCVARGRLRLRDGTGRHVEAGARGNHPRRRSRRVPCAATRQRTGISPNNAAVRLHRARQALGRQIRRTCAAGSIAALRDCDCDCANEG